MKIAAGERRHDDPASMTLAQRVVAEQVRAHYRQIPAMVIAPSAGGLFTAWVLWDAVRNVYLVAGMTAVITLSAMRLALYRRYFAASTEQAAQRHWKVLAVAAAGVSGVIWGSAAPFLYPPNSPGYEVDEGMRRTQARSTAWPRGQRVEDSIHRGLSRSLGGIFECAARSCPSRGLEHHPQRSWLIAALQAIAIIALRTTGIASRSKPSGRILSTATSSGLESRLCWSPWVAASSKGLGHLSPSTGKAAKPAFTDHTGIRRPCAIA